MTSPPGPPVLRGLALGDDPEVWRTLGFTVVADRVALGGVWLHLTGVGGGLLGWQLEPPHPAAVDGIAPVAGCAPDAPATEGDRVVHPNGVTGVDHVVVATRDHERTASALAEVGLRPRRTVDGARGDTATRYRFTLLGTCVLEVVGPVEPAVDPGPARLVGIALVAPRLDTFGEHAGEPRPAVQPGRHIVTLRTRELGGEVPVAVLTPRVTPPADRRGRGEERGRSAWKPSSSA